jgi:hypothetical protein
MQKPTACLHRYKRHTSALTQRTAPGGSHGGQIDKVWFCHPCHRRAQPWAAKHMAGMNMFELSIRPSMFH